MSDGEAYKPIAFAQKWLRMEFFRDPDTDPEIPGPETPAEIHLWLWRLRYKFGKRVYVVQLL